MRLSSPAVLLLATFAWVSASFFASFNLERLPVYNAPHLESSQTSQIFKRAVNLTGHAWFLLLAISLGFSSLAFLNARPLIALVILSLPSTSFFTASLRLPYPEKNNIYWHQNKKPMVLVAKYISSKSAYHHTVEVTQIFRPYYARVVGKATLTTKEKWTKIEARQKFKIIGSIRAIEKKTNSWSINRRQYFYRQGIYSRIKAESIDKLQHKNVASNPSQICQDKLDKLRLAIINKHRNILGRVAGDLLSGIVLGDRATKMPKELSNNFRKLGLSHLLAASGFNLSILVGSILFVFSKIKTRPFWTSLTAALAVLIFTALAGASASVTRAAAMWLLVILGKTFYKKLNSMALLCTSLLGFSLINPLLLLDIGLQLSYAATFSIVLGMQNINQALKGFKDSLPKTIFWLLELSVVILLAQASVLPLQLYYFWELGLLFLPANLVLDPVVAPITVGGFISSILVIVTELIPISAQPNNFLVYSIDSLVSLPLQFMIQTAAKLASIKNSTVCLGPPPLWAVTFYLLAFFYLLSNFKPRSQTILATVIFALAFSTLLLRFDRREETLLLVSKNLLAQIKDNEIKVSNLRSFNYRSTKRCLESHSTGSNHEVRVLGKQGLVQLESDSTLILTLLNRSGRLKKLTNKSLEKITKKLKLSTSKKKAIVLISNSKKRSIKKLPGLSVFLVSPGSRGFLIIKPKCQNPKTRQTIPASLADFKNVIPARSLQQHDTTFNTNAFLISLVKSNPDKVIKTPHLDFHF